MLIYSVSLSTLAIFLGVLWIVTHLIPLLKPFYFQDLFQRFPRSQTAGYVTLAIATLWATSLLASIDLGEYNRMRTTFIFATLIGGVLSCFYITDFLSVRGLGMILLLASNVILDAAFMVNHPAKVVLVIQAYAWIIAGIIMVTSPYLIRRAIQWATAELSRWKFLMAAGTLWGFVLLLLGILVF